MGPGGADAVLALPANAAADGKEDDDEEDGGGGGDDCEHRPREVVSRNGPLNNGEVKHTAVLLHVSPAVLCRRGARPGRSSDHSARQGTARC